MSIDDNNLSITIGFPASPAPPNEISFDEVAGMISSGKIVSKFTLLSFCLYIGLFEVLPFIKESSGSLFFSPCKAPIGLLFTCESGAFTCNKLRPSSD